MFLLANKQDMLFSLEILWKGMLSIFLVLALIYISIIILNYVTNKKKMAKLKVKIVETTQKLKEKIFKK